MSCSLSVSGLFTVLFTPAERPLFLSLLDLRYPECHCAAARVAVMCSEGSRVSCLPVGAVTHSTHCVVGGQCLLAVDIPRTPSAEE